MGAATVATPVVTTDVAALTAVADKFEKIGRASCRERV